MHTSSLAHKTVQQCVTANLRSSKFYVSADGCHDHGQKVSHRDLHEYYAHRIRLYQRCKGCVLMHLHNVFGYLLFIIIQVYF